MIPVRTSFRIALLAPLLFGVAWTAGCEKPPSGPPTAEVTPVLERQEAAPGSKLIAALKVSLPKGVHTQSNEPREKDLIATTLKLSAPPGLTVDEIVWPPATDLVQSPNSPPLAVFENEFAIGVRMTVAADAAPGPRTVKGHMCYQACDEISCYSPKPADVTWTVRIGAGGSAGPRSQPEIFDAIAKLPGKNPEEQRTEPNSCSKPAAASADSAKTSEILAQLDGFDMLGSTSLATTREFLDFIQNAKDGVKEKGLFEDRGPLAILLLVFLGGLALNLTPCVLPMIPINLAIIGAGAQAGSRSRGFLLGSVYGGAMALVYGVLGLVVILTAGTFGTINASPWFNAGIAVLFAVLALAMFDVVTIDFSKYSSAFRPDGKSRGTFLLAFTMGAVAALLAGACVAPVVIQVVLFSSNLYAAGTPAALALPFLLGAGMALPWPIAGAGMASLPKPGAWMTRVKQAFGVLILVTAAYYGYQAYELFSDRWVDPEAVESAVEEQLAAGWTPSLADGLATAQRDKSPVLIDFWATWCKNCLKMDKTTLRDPAVVDALAGYVKIKVKTEDLAAPDVKPIADRFRIIGLPAYIVLRPKDNSAALSDSVLQ